MKFAAVLFLCATSMSSLAMAEDGRNDGAQAAQISRLMLQFSADGVLNDDRRKAAMARHEVSEWADQMRHLLQYDGNGDGALSAAELEAARGGAALDQMVQRGDSDEDGALSWDELSDVARHNVMQVDPCAATCSNLISLWMSI